MLTYSIPEKDLGFATVKMISPQIFQTLVRENTTIDVESLLKIKEVNRELADGKKYGVLVESDMMTNITRDAMKLSASKEFQENTVAKALIIKSIGHQIVGSFYLKFNKPHIPTRIFKEKEEALEWLSQMLVQ
ncbi:MAG: hypothetical protein H6600_02895 [Flavobacteriales bacterium]|nr:hypothetical protein [Flavobacteriales bacterium]MCB9197378.1 hypothetical protein [Flavobacteriales bacterium]